MKSRCRLFFVALTMAGFVVGCGRSAIKESPIGEYPNTIVVFNKSLHHLKVYKNNASLEGQRRSNVPPIEIAPSETLVMGYAPGSHPAWLIEAAEAGSNSPPIMVTVR